MPEPTRRYALKLGLGAAALVALGPLALWMRPTRYRPVPEALQTLSEREFAIFAAIADRMLRPGGGLPTAAAVQVTLEADKYIASKHPDDIAEIKIALELVENALAGLFLDGRFRPFTQCEPAQQDAILEGWRTSRNPVRQAAFKTLQGLVTSPYWGNADVYQRIGYPGPPDYSQIRSVRFGTTAREAGRR